MLLVGLYLVAEAIYWLLYLALQVVLWTLVVVWYALRPIARVVIGYIASRESAYHAARVRAWHRAQRPPPLVRAPYSASEKLRQGRYL